LFKKLVSLAIVLILFTGVSAYAVDLGLYQDFAGSTSFRFDTRNVFVQPALDFSSAKIGYKKFLTNNLYMKSDLKFKQNKNNKMKYDTLGVGLGYPIKDFGQKFRVEGTVRNPVITEVKDWTFDVGISWQFSLPILENEEV